MFLKNSILTIVYAITYAYLTENKQNGCLLPDGCSFFEKNVLSTELYNDYYMFLHCKPQKYAVYDLKMFNNSGPECKLRKRNLYITVSPSTFG